MALKGPTMAMALITALFAALGWGAWQEYRNFRRHETQVHRLHQLSGTIVHLDKEEGSAALDAHRRRVVLAVFSVIIVMSLSLCTGIAVMRALRTRLGERKRGEEEHLQSRQDILNILESITDAFYALDREWRFTYLNPQAERLLRRTREELLGKNVWEAFPQAIHSRIYREYHRAVKERITIEFEEYYVPLDTWFAARVYPHGNGLSVYFRDITERKQSQDRINASLKEKEVLLREIHHRVKNNLQIISSMINLQIRQTQDKKVHEIFKELQNRIKSMALIHESLYQSESLSQIDFVEYVRTLLAHLSRSYGAASTGIELKVHVHEVSLGLDTIIPLGLIINELASNSLKHAFPNGHQGDIAVDLRSEQDHRVTLTVRDDGVGLPEDLDFRNARSLGLQLVATLTHQLEGTIELDGRAGTVCTIRFPGQTIDSEGEAQTSLHPMEGSRS